MSLASMPIHESGCSLADWVEFKTLVAEYKLYRLSGLTRIMDEEQGEENEDFTEQDAINERLLEAVAEELAVRAKYLSSAYPFYFNDDQTELHCCKEWTVGQYIYLYCLIFSHVNREEVLLVSPPAGNADRDIMQICATYAAAGIVHGNAVSFGFPRPDHSNFLDALKKTYASVGEGEVHDQIPAGAPRDEKDARIDVIAWDNSLDGAPGRYYLLGQVATGKNWKNKSIMGEISLFHNTWFKQSPPSTPNPAMFIPFCIEKEENATLSQAMSYLTEKFGKVYYRYRLPKYAEDGFLLASNDEKKEYQVDRIGEVSKIKNYVESFLAILNQPYSD